MSPDKNRERIMEDLAALSLIPAPTFSESRRLEWLEQRLATAPGVRLRDSAGNLIWRWGEGRPRLLVTAHVDSVFGDDTKLDVRHADGKIVGPGVGDNAAAIAVTISVVCQLLEERPLAAGAVAFTVGEEGLGNLKGARVVTADLQPELFIAVEGHLLDRVLVDAVGSVRARVTISGPGGHPWVDRGRPSALHELFAVGSSLLETERGDSSVNIGLASGGRSVNSIAAEASLVVECRSLDSALLQRFEERLKGLTLKPPLAVQTEMLGYRLAGRLDRDHRLLRAVIEVRERLGLAATLGSGSTDANVPLGEGIPALTLGVARGGEMHTPREWIDQASLDLGRSQLYEVIKRLLA
jgi:tripeptide aminopeptidase